MSGCLSVTRSLYAIGCLLILFLLLLLPVDLSPAAAQPAPEGFSGDGSAGDARSFDPSEIEAVAAANTAFALELYRHLRDPQENFVCSPYSIATALAMTYAGARGETEAQMSRVLRLGPNAEALHAAAGELRANLLERADGEEIVLRIANALWEQSGYGILDWYRELVESRYAGALEELDFATAPDAARARINGWVARETEARIPELIAPGLLGPLTRLVLTNAIYLRAPWQKRFAERSPEAPFTGADGAIVQVPMMHLIEELPYLEEEGAQVLALPYRNPQLAMLIVLPTAIQGLPALEAQLSPARVSAWLTGPQRRRVSVFLPRFTLRHRLRLEPALSALGMPDAFSPDEADFRGIDGRAELHLSAVVHETFLEVSEEGTEAAGATAVIAALTAMRPLDPRRPTPIFRADHPFLFLIVDRPTGSILFLGRLAAPGE